MACPDCRAQWLDRKRPRCTQCALALSNTDDRLCAACVKEPPDHDRTLAGVDYAAPLDRVVQRLKFGGGLELAALGRDLLAPLLSDEQDKPDFLCPVPLAPARLAERGYNQALEIARPLARKAGLRLHPGLLLRVRDTAPQTGVPAARRHRNVRGAFLLAPHLAPLVAHRHVGVVDDVMTTGATLNEIAALLKRYGARRVTNLVLARTPVPD